MDIVQFLKQCCLQGKDGGSGQGLLAYRTPQQQEVFTRKLPVVFLQMECHAVLERHLLLQVTIGEGLKFKNIAPLPTI